MSKKNKRKVNKGKFAKFILFFSVCFYIGWTLISQQIEIIETNKQISSINAELDAENQKREGLIAQKELGSDPKFIEKIAREKLDYVAPDETVFIDATQIK